jgi:hypothetical protein
MKLKSLLGVGSLLLAAAGFTGCATTALPGVPLGPNQARVTGHKATFTDGVTILMIPRSPVAGQGWSNELIIPAGRNRLGIRYETMSLGGLNGAIADGIAAYKAAEIEFEAEAGHEYFAQMSGITIFTMGYRVTDTTTGKVILDTKPSKQPHPGSLPQ